MADDQNKSKNRRAPNSLTDNSFESAAERLGRKSLAQDPDYFATEAILSRFQSAADAVPEVTQGPVWQQKVDYYKNRLSYREDFARAKGVTSVLREMNSIGEHAEGFLNKRGIREEVRSGSISLIGANEPVKMSNINEALTQQANKLTEALKQLTEGAGKSAEELSQLRQQAFEASKNYQKLTKANANNNNRMNSWSQTASAIGGGFMAAANAAGNILVSQRLGQETNRAGYANLENEKYSMYQKATQGDVMSQLLLAQWGGAEAFGKELRTGVKITQGLRLGGAGAQTAAGGITAYATGGLVGTGDIANGTAEIASTASNMARGVDMGMADIEGRRARMESMRALLAISAQQLQGFRDYSVGLGTAAMNMGGSGGAFLNESLSGSSLSKMLVKRISVDDFAKMSNFGAENMGSMFDQNQIYGAMGLQRSGMGSKEVNMARMAELAAAGSNNPQAGLAAVLEAALSKGLDNSKVLGIVATNTAAMVSSNNARALGLDTTATAAYLSTSLVNTADPNKEYAANRAMSTAEYFSKLGTNTDVSLAGMVNTARATRAFGGGFQGLYAAQIDPQTLLDLQMKIDMDQSPNGQATKDAMQVLAGLGYKPGSDPVKFRKDLSKMINLKQTQAIENKLKLGIHEGEEGIDLDWIRNFGDVTEEKMQKITPNQRAVLKRMAGQATPEEYLKNIHLFSREGQLERVNQIKAQKAQSDDYMRGEGGSELYKQLHDMFTSGDVQKTKAALKAVDQFGAGDPKELLEKLKTITKEAENSGGEDIDAAKAAGSFGENTKLFGKHVDTFGQAVKILADKAGIKPEPTPAAISKSAAKDITGLSLWRFGP